MLRPMLINFYISFLKSIFILLTWVSLRCNYIFRAIDSDSESDHFPDNKDIATNYNDYIPLWMVRIC